MSFVIGAEIKKRLKAKGLKNKSFADMMHMEERNLYHFFKREQMEVDLLLRAGQILDYDFLTLYIKNSKYKDYLGHTNLEQPNTVNEPVIEYEKKQNQISFSINICGPFDTVTKEMSNFLQSIKDEAEKRGLKIV